MIISSFTYETLKVKGDTSSDNSTSSILNIKLSSLCIVLKINCNISKLDIRRRAISLRNSKLISGLSISNIGNKFLRTSYLCDLTSNIIRNCLTRNRKSSISGSKSSLNGLNNSSPSSTIPNLTLKGRRMDIKLSYSTCSRKIIYNKNRLREALGSTIDFMSVTKEIKLIFRLLSIRSSLISNRREDMPTKRIANSS